MNKMHSLARIVFAALGIYIMLSLIPYVISSVSMLFTGGFELRSAAWFLANLLITAMLMALLYYFLVRNCDQLAQKVVGTVEQVDPSNQIHWLPVAFRLICFVAGVIVVYRFLIGISHPFRILALLRQGGENRFFARILVDFLGWLVLLPFGIYLLYGAPHFVRWQIRKTLELCREFDQTEENDESEETK